MKIVVICGSHPRHLFVVKEVINTGLVAGVVLMKREEMIHVTPRGLSKDLTELYEHHFRLRNEMEEKYFEGIDKSLFIGRIPILEINREELNSIKVEEFIKNVGADCLFSYGPDLIKENILNLVDNFAFNLHGGLSPWYKGSATMFWPFYFLEPNYAGTTLHYITKRIDAGNIINHTVPKLDYGDGMHEVACKAVVAAAYETRDVLSRIDKKGRPEGVVQKKNGKLFLDKDWRPEHLYLIYDLYKDAIVDRFLDGEINRNNEPNLIKFI